MNNEEIKEILEDVKRHLDYVETTKQCSIRDNEMKVMYDCITNLQEKNKKDKEFLKQCGFVNVQQLVLAYLGCISRINKAIPMLEELNIKLKDILKIGINIKEISDIENLLQGSDKG